LPLPGTAASKMSTPSQDSKTAIGVDIIEIDRIKRAISRWQDSFLKRIYTTAELKNFKNISSLAARYAAKEAVMKALSTGARGVRWTDIEILTNGNGAPLVQLYGRALKKSTEIGIGRFDISISHSRKYAIAFVIGYAK
jgi:holo-[acyl-carrier protein] synthase